MIDFTLCWLGGTVVTFVVAAYLTTPSRRTWWRPLLLAFVAAGGLLQIPLFGPDGGMFMPALLYLFIGAPPPVFALFFAAVLAFWTGALVVRRYRLVLSPQFSTEAAPMFASYTAQSPSGSARTWPWITILFFGLTTGAAQSLLFLFWRLDSRVVLRVGRALHLGWERNWSAPWLGSILFALVLGAAGGGLLELLVWRRETRTRGDSLRRCP